MQQANRHMQGIHMDEIRAMQKLREPFVALHFLDLQLGAGLGWTKERYSQSHLVLNAPCLLQKYRSLLCSMRDGHQIVKDTSSRSALECTDFKNVKLPATQSL